MRQVGLIAIFICKSTTNDFDVINNLIMPLLYCSVTSVVTIWGGKLYLEKRIGHSFDKKIENYKSSRGRENIGYQIDKAEFSKEIRTC